MKRIDLRWAATLALSTALGGCGGEEFDPFGRLTSLRVLAIQSEPVSPGPGETTTLMPSLYIPGSHSEPTFSWSWCPVPGSSYDGYPCEFDEESLGALTGMMDIPPLDLGEGETATLRNPMASDLLPELCATSSGGPEAFSCDEDWPVQVKLTVATDEDEVVAVRTLYLPFEPPQEVNTNPTLEGLEVRLNGEWVDVTEEFDTPLPRDEATKLRAKVSEDQAQRYETRSADGGSARERERLTISWFVETGTTKFERTGFIDGTTTIATLANNEWVPERHEDYPEDTAEILLVIRDNREGVSWQRFSVRLAEEP